MDSILKLNEVIRRVGLSRSSLYARISVGTFPRPVSLGVRAVGWRESEITAWVSGLSEKGALVSPSLRR